MVKTSPLNDDAHKCLKEAQMIIYKKYNRQISFSDILSYLLRDPEDVAKKVMDVRFQEHQDIISEDFRSNDAGNNEQKSPRIVLVEQGDVRT